MHCLLFLWSTGVGHPFFRVLHRFPMSSHSVLEMGWEQLLLPRLMETSLEEPFVQSELQRQLSTWFPSLASCIHTPHCQSSSIMRRYEHVMAALPWLTFNYKRKSMTPEAHSDLSLAQMAFTHMLFSVAGMPSSFFSFFKWGFWGKERNAFL